MPSEVICPTCGQALRIELRDELQEPNGSPAAARTMEVIIPGTLSSCGDLDEPSVSLASPDPDPILGAFVCGDPGPIPDHDRSLTLRPSTAELPAQAPLVAGEVESPDPDTADPLASLNFGGPPSVLSGSAASDDQIDEEDEQGDEKSRGPGLAFILLASYASAVTLACLWLILSGRGRLQSRTAETIPADSRPDLEGQGRRAQEVAPVPPVPENRLTSLGQPLRLGSLEFTPVAVEAGSVDLRHTALAGGPKRRKGGADALRMRVRLRNLSSDASFVPLDPAFVREHDRGLPDSFIETGHGDRIDIFPLAVESEWTIAGQTFPELKPGESVETFIVSAPDAKARVSDAMTWRLKLRCGIEQTEVVGVRFGVNDIKPRGG